jgi:hypothetical protein
MYPWSELIFIIIILLADIITLKFIELLIGFEVIIASVCMYDNVIMTLHNVTYVYEEGNDCVVRTIYGII